MCLSTSSAFVCWVKLFVRTTLLALASASSGSLSNAAQASRERAATQDSLLFLLVLRRCTWPQSVRLILTFFRQLPLLLDVAFGQLCYVDTLPGLSKLSQLNQVCNTMVICM